MQPSIPLVSTSHRHFAHVHWACCPPGRQVPLHRPQVDLSLCCIPGLCFPRCKNTCLYSIYTYTCLCSIWFVLYSSSAFNWLCARAAQKVWVSPRCTHSTADGAKWRLLSWPGAGLLEQWKQPVAIQIPEWTITWLSGLTLANYFEVISSIFILQHSCSYAIFLSAMWTSVMISHVPQPLKWSFWF